MITAYAISLKLSCLSKYGLLFVFSYEYV